MKQLIKESVNTYIFLFCILFLHLPVKQISAQVDDQIQLSASFAASIELRIDENPNVSWTIETIDKYEHGFWPVERPIAFSVSSSTNFRVDMVNTPFQNSEGVALDIRNLGYRLTPRNSDVQAFYKKRYDWATPDGGGISARLSGIYIASFTPKTIIVPGPSGNAGSFTANAFRIRIGIAADNIRPITGLPNLLEQNITPGTYTTVLTLTAYQEP